MHDGNGRRTGVILGIAGAGLLLGHWLTYLVEMPAGARDQVLGATGHGYLASAGQLAAVVAAASLAIVFLGRLTGRHGGEAFPSVAARLAVVQASAFVAMEVLERMSVGASMSDLVTILPIGLVAQTMVAVLGAWALRLVLRSADAATVLVDPSAPALHRPMLVLTPAFVAPPRQHVMGSRPSRAPPSAA